MKIVNIYEARGQFSRLLEEAEAGEEVVIARNGKPIVRLQPLNPPARRFGRYRDVVAMPTDADWAAADDAAARSFQASLGRDL